MIINIDKTNLMFISSRQNGKCMKDNKLAIKTKWKLSDDVVQISLNY